jgi:hypothetical protein
MSALCRQSIVSRIAPRRSHPPGLPAHRAKEVDFSRSSLLTQTQ